ncbi:MAG: DUF2207 domain-containing protein [Ruminococcaceae bacterium]|nr:DUF2207 domain-containing protein [Oscillospiraceae bacterium]
MSEAKYVEGQNLVFRGKPLLREGNTFCYGSMSDKYVLFMMVLSNKKIKDEDGKDIEIPDKIILQVLNTDAKLPPHERVVKQFERNGLFDAMDIGLVWLDRLNKEEK